MHASDKFTPVDFGDLAKKDVGSAVIVSTDIHGIFITGAAPPKGMITFSKDGNIYHGFLIALSKNSLTVAPKAGVPVFEIEKKHIKDIKILKTEQDAAANP